MIDRRHPVTLAVFGAALGSLGEAVADRVLAAGHEAITIGVSSNEDVDFNDVRAQGPAFFEDHSITDVLVTIGTNQPVAVNDVLLRARLTESYFTNVGLPAEILQNGIASESVQSMAFISSNSAHIARTNSAPYCATKAALSMLIRVAAREQKGRPLLYTYEPGLIDNTPMTRASADSFGGPLHRIPGLEPREGLPLKEMAALIGNNFFQPSLALNGATIRLDGGEQ